MQEKNAPEGEIFCLAKRRFVLSVGAARLWCGSRTMPRPSAFRFIANETDSEAAASHAKRVILQGNFQSSRAGKNDGRRTIVRKHASALAVCVVLLAVLPLVAQAPSQVDLYAIHQIKEEGFNNSNSKVMEIMSYLTDVYGPRLTNSPDIKEAAAWTTSKMKEWQLANVHLEPWGPFGRGWSNERFSAQVISPRQFPLIAYPKAWTPGTNGPVSAPAVLAPILKEEDIQKYRGQLKGKFVLTAAVPENPERFEPQAHRYTDAELADLASQPVPAAQNPEDRVAQFRAQRELQLKVQKFLVEEGVAAWIEPSRGG